MTPPHPIIALHLAISSGHYILVPVAFASILSEVLTITLSTIPFSSANLWSAYVTSHWISIGIIGIMVCVLGLLFFYAKPKLPLKPETVAGQLFYLSGSGLPSFLKTLGMLEEESWGRIEQMGLRYGFDVYQVEGGTMRLKVDFKHEQDHMGACLPK